MTAIRRNRFRRMGEAFQFGDLEAVRVEPQNEVVHFRLASVYKTLGDTPNHQKEMASFQKLHSAGVSNGLPLTSPSVTQQVIDPESHMQ